ncbi:MAG: glycosyltransferase family 4 protein [Bernardetiaceae bacterium]|nr:glycosyltransferase family 4 protein [Bernardetiaceae bacterium]
MAKTWRGGERQTILLLEALIKNQIITQILICRKNSALEKYCKQHNLPHKSFDKNIKSYWQIPSFISNLQKKQKSKFIVHAHESAGHTYATLSKLIFNSNIFIVVHRRVLFSIKKKFTNRFKYSEKYIERIICISKAVEQVLQDSTGYKATVVVPSMIKMSDEQNQNHIDLREIYCIKSDTIIAYIAALEPEKDHFTFLETAKKIIKQQPSVHFLIVGTGSLESKLKEYTAKLEIQNQVTFTGFISQAERIIPQTDILLFTSMSEGLGSTILDYFAHRKAVVSTRNGGAESVITHGENGFLSEVGDSTNLAKHVLYLLNDATSYQKISEQAYTDVKNKYTQKTISEKIVRVYNQVLKK